MTVLGRGLCRSHAQDAKGLGKVGLGHQVEGGPFEQVEGVDILDHDAGLDKLPDGGDGGELGHGVVELALSTYFDSLKGSAGPTCTRCSVDERR